MSDKTIIRLATRGSALALWQADRIAELILQVAGASSPWKELPGGSQPSLTVQKVIISTKPDRIQDRPLSEMGGDKGLFVKEVEQAVLDGRADAAVHSLKDVPVDEITPGLRLAAFPERADPRDVLITRTGQPLSALPPGSVVATGAPRRQAQLLALRPDLKVCGVRGNVETRVRKLRDGEFDAIIMAAAGLHRLGMQSQITESFSIDQFIPAPGQGIVVVQAPTDSPWADIWTAIDNPTVRLQAEVERQWSHQIGATCHTAAGCYLEVTGARARLRAVVLSPDGARELRADRESSVTDAPHLAQTVAEELLQQGAQNLI